MYCGNCGNNIKSNDSFCPYCGRQVINNNNEYYQNTTYNSTPALRSGTNGIAIAGFILAFIFPLLGLILSCVGLASSKDYYNHSGRGLSIAGIIISLIPIILVILLIMGIISLGAAIA